MVVELGQDEFEYKLTSGFTTRSGVRGYIPKDLWFAINRKENWSTLTGCPQLFMIVSENGLEWGFGATMHPSDFSNSNIKQMVRDAAKVIFPQLPAAESKVAHELERSLTQSEHDWRFCRKQRLAEQEADFSSLDLWLMFMRSDEGVRWAGGCISAIAPASVVSSIDLKIASSEMASLFGGLMRSIRPTSQLENAEEEHVHNQSQTAQRVWIEKTIVNGRPDREVGDYALGKALWSPQKNTRGGDIYKAMRDVSEGDIILHLTNNEGITGYSKAASGADTNFVGLVGTDWEGQPGYRVPLQEYTPLVPPLDRDEFFGVKQHAEAMLKLLDAGVSGLFYNRNLELNQGAYLTAAPNELLHILNGAYIRKTGRSLPFMEGNTQPQTVSNEPLHSQAYTIDEAAEDLFLTRSAIEEYLGIWGRKKNLILQGAPGVGKSFVARRLAYLLCGTKNDNFIQTVQFHQSYSYEDFVQGFRPSSDGGFARKDGVFIEFRNRALADPEQKFVLIIDEINRGNLSKIFGELMLLIEPDKRGPEWRTRITYADDADGDFFVPDNLYLLGMMNTADRSLSLVDYALRRRFSFVTIAPQFESPRYKSHLIEKGVSDEVCNRIISRMSDLNETVALDRINLGPGFRIGHSFFTPNQRVDDSEAWYRMIVETEIYPLLEEYWFDAPVTADQWREKLLG